MNEREALLAAIRADPADDTPRLVYADWLREQPGEYDRALGRFVWAGVTLARFRGREVVEDGMFFDAIRDQTESAPRVLDVQARYLFGWDRLTTEWAWDNEAAAPDRITLASIPPKSEVPLTRRELRERRRTRLPEPALIWERGFVAGVRVPLYQLFHDAGRFLRACPVERFEAVEVPGLTFRVQGPADGWRLSGELKVEVRRVGTAANPPKNTVVEYTSALPSPGWEPGREHLVERAGRFAYSLCSFLMIQSGNRWPGPETLPEPADPAGGMPGMG